ncbi:MAG: hypothetical protein ACYS32_00625 [Planctomycetota bacterium]|jgi:hypothetical protein
MSAPNFDRLPEVPREDNMGFGLWDYLTKIKEFAEEVALRFKENTETWTLPYFLNGWENYGGDYQVIGYHKDFTDTVHIRGVCKSGTLAETIFILPVKYRPAQHIMFPVATDNDSTGHVTVHKTGEVKATSGCSTVMTSLSGISFKV